MALQFIIGGSGSGKSHYLYRNITEEASQRPEREYIVLVPEQFTMQTQKDLVLASKKKGIMNIDVLSFARLAHRIFEETGKSGFPVLDDEGKNLVLRRIAGKYESQLKVLGGNIRKLGYISEVKSVLSEFTQYDIGMEELKRVMESAGEGSPFYYKLQDIALLYEGFQEYLREKYITREELLDVLSGVAAESAILKKSTLVLDGFAGFTPVQNRLLGVLLRQCRDVVVTVTMDDRENPYSYDSPYQLFAMGKRTVTTLIRIAGEANVPVKESIVLAEKPFPRFRAAKALGFLEQELFRYSRKTYIEETKELEIHAARNPAEEALAAAAMARRLVRENGWRYREIGLIVSDMEVYGSYIKQAFMRYEIPVFMDQKRSILLNSFVEYIRSLLAMAEQNFTYDSVFRFLRTGYAPFSQEETDSLENYVIGLGIKGYKNWQSRWIRRTKDMTEEELEQVNHCRVTLVEKVDGLMYVLKQRRKTVRDVTEALYDFLAGEQMQTVLKGQEEAFAEEGELALAREYAQIYRIVLDLFDKFVELLGTEQVSLEEYCKLLDAGLEEAKVGVIPPGVDQVVAGDLERTRLKDIKALLFLGANDAYLPGALLNNSLLSERDREKFAKEKLTLTPGGKEKAYMQKYYLYTNLTKPTKKLCLFYSRVSADGKSMRPAYLIQEIRRLFPKMEVIEEEKKRLWEKELTERSGLADLIEGLRLDGKKEGGAWMELYNWYKGHEAWGDKISLLLDAGFYRRPGDAVSKAAARQLYGERFEDSITRMEQFSACAFAHFLKYGLRLRKRQEYEFQAVDLGNVLHGAIERYSRKVDRSGRSWIELSEEEQKALASESVEEAITDYGNSVLYSSARNTYLITRLKHMMNRTVWALTEQLRRGDFRPAAYELTFANGKIDRMDTCVDGGEVYVRIVDYKTGHAAFDVSLLYHGLQLQLMVYMNAATALARQKYPGRDIIPSGVFYYHIQDPLVEKGTPEEEIPWKILKELKPDGLVNLERESLFHLEKIREGESLAAPVKFKKDGSLAAASKAVAAEDFKTMTDYAGWKVQRLHEEIVEGKAEVRPYRQGNRTGCDYCPYRHVCGFDAGLQGYSYRDIGKLDKTEAVARMKREL